jgi:hypothetical protein
MITILRNRTMVIRREEVSNISSLDGQKDFF